MAIYFVKIIFFTTITQIISFNLSPNLSIIFNEPIKSSSNSYFGYSVHLRSGVDSLPSSVVIGAPKANSTFLHLKYINEPGAVYQCDIENDPVCKPLLLDPEGDTKGIYNGISYTHGKTNSWLGATLDGETTRDGKLAACAPRWINRHHIQQTDKHPLAVGMCYYEPNTRNINSPANKIIPFLSRKDEDRNFVAELGMSLHMPKADGQIFMGAPGLNYWTGGVVLYKTRYAGNQVITYYGNPPYYSYLGYAVSSGKITKNGGLFYFASAPRAHEYKGLVKVLVLIGSELIEVESMKHFFMGEHLGEYFGASICLVDVNNDGLDDVLIGAPRYSISSANIESGDEGAVYVYINKNNLKFQRQDKLKSKQETLSQFGTSITSLGDLDKDGYNDVAVGAPYEDGGRGAIYIYLGSANGLNVKYSQHIRARDINLNLFGFGISLSKGVDIDGNFYNDLAVGSYKSGHVVLFRSHPVIELKGEIRPNKREISLDTTKFTTKICMKFWGKEVPLNTTIQLIFNVDSLYKRAIIDEAHNAMMTKPISLIQGIENCLETAVSITATVQDFSNPIDLELTYKVLESEDKSKFCPFCPVLNPSTSTMVKVQVPYVTGCSEDSKCKPDLKMNAVISDTITVGSKKSVFLNITLTNSGDPAFITRLFINMPNLLGFVQLPENCMEIEKHQINCEFYTFLSKDTKKLDMELNTFKITNNLLPYKINLTVTSAGEEQNFIDNNVVLPLELVTESELRLLGNSSTELLRFDQNKNKNYTTIQEFIVQNLGPSPIDEVLLEIYIPVLYDNVTIFRVLKPKDAVCSASGTGFYTNPIDDSPKEMNVENHSIMTRDTSNLDMDDMNLRLQKYNSSENNSNFQNINRTVFFNCSNLSEGRITCLTVTCRLPLLEDMETKGTVKITTEPQIDNIDIVLGDKDTLQVEFLAFSEPIIQLNKSSGSRTSLGLTINRTSPDEQCPILFIILAIILGIVILGLMVWGLWKYGFFKRNTKEQLNLLQKGKVSEEMYDE
ncbi:integrin alpha-PS3-like [Chrysoperla carnea]|uniref:integrin alpha-PS3-like n=1 Tax=Chrysoperla carnea TaxID=189513 RepID=UPI001D090CD0|nr:integrin alpha-PS3-like [Chrysoperla carnea]